MIAEFFALSSVFFCFRPSDQKLYAVRGNKPVLLHKSQTCVQFLSLLLPFHPIFLWGKLIFGSHSKQKNTRKAVFPVLLVFY